MLNAERRDLHLYESFRNPRTGMHATQDTEDNASSELKRLWGLQMSPIVRLASNIHACGLDPVVVTTHPVAGTAGSGRVVQLANGGTHCIWTAHC